MYTLTELRKIIETEIAKLSFDKEPQNLYTPIAYTLESGGKRIRPTLFLAACQLFSDNIMQAVNPALGFEVFHNFTLIHDDIMDNSDKRRNNPTVHKKWNTNRAILSGDAMLIEAYNLIMKSPADKFPALMQLFNQTALEVCEGQQYDMDFETDILASFDEYIKMIRLKTAVLLAASLKGGAIMGNANNDDMQYLYDFGIKLGIAFQLQDDLLDVYADENLLGKPIGADVRECKRNALYQEVMLVLDERGKGSFRTFYKNRLLENRLKFAHVKQLYDKYDIATKVEKRIKFHYEKAIKSLGKVSVSINKKQMLYDLGEQIMNRKK